MSISDDANQKWCVIRQADGGAQVIEAPGVSRQEALAHMERREKEIGDHHQAVWVERYPPPNPNAQPL